MASLVIMVAMAWGALLLVFRRPLAALWREPVFRHPILILESDDWGAGPARQASVLRALAALGSGFRDSSGRRPIMSIAVILALPRPLAAGGEYRRVDLSAPEHAEILEALRVGTAAGAFALQLHGMEHFWPPAVLRAARRETAVAAWLAEPELTEALPPPLQSRWTDASVLPSLPLSDAEIRAAVRDETRLFKAIFGRLPEVVVPPTFVWDGRVESAWVEAGVRFVVTPGRRYEGRDGAGRPMGAGGGIRNGMAAAGGGRYLVRDDYFEPALGHKAGDALRALREKTGLGRPCLLEIHRCNFLDEERLAGVLGEVRELYRSALEAYPDLCFISPLELGEAIVQRDPARIDRRASARFSCWCRRALQLPRFARLARLTGLALFMRLVGH